MKRNADAKDEKKAKQGHPRPGQAAQSRPGQDTENEPNKTVQASPEEEEDVTFWAELFETADAQFEDNKNETASASTECNRLWAEQTPLETIVEEDDMDVGDEARGPGPKHL